MNPAPRIAIITPHTHWDREWYRTFPTFRVQLVRVVREALDLLESDSAFTHFLLDGQAVILEDYLEVHPEDEERIGKLVKAGRLSIGPWYILPDEFLVSGEATIRNLMFGHSVGGRFGPVQKVGYMPDSFGHIAQMPQILRRAGIDSFIYTRGVGDEIDLTGLEYIWTAPDGSEVLAVNQAGGYCAGGALGFKEITDSLTPLRVDTGLAVAQVQGIFRKISERSRGDVYLLSNGCDHLPPQPEFDRVLEALREAFPETEFRVGSLSDYLSLVTEGDFARQKHQGELLGGKLHHILSGVWSARMYLKQLNDEAQTLLSGIAEPCSAYTRFMHGREWPAGLLRETWRSLLRNHPHDSICGCSIDEVHEDMLPRFRMATDTAEAVVTGELQSLLPRLAREPAAQPDTALCVFNPLPTARSETIERVLVLPAEGLDPSRIEVTNEAGKPVPSHVLRTEYAARFWSHDYQSMLRPGPQQRALDTYRERAPGRLGGRKDGDAFVSLLFRADLPPCGHAIFRIRQSDHPAPESTSPSLAQGTDTLENGLVRVRLHANGILDLEDLRTGTRYPGLNRLTDTEDAGDEYDYAPAPESRTITADSARGRVKVIEDSPLRSRLEASFGLMLPARLAPERRQREDRLDECPVRVRVTLERDSPVVDIETVFDNRVLDHRLRAEFPAAVVSGEVISDGHFYLNRRDATFPDGTGWVQPPTGTFPQQDWSLVQDGSKGLAVLSRGLPEVAPLPGAAGTLGLAVTLLRAVGWLSRDDFDTRRRTAVGPMIHTPGAQCRGVHRFQYAVVPFAGELLEAGIDRLSQRWRLAPVAVQGVMDGQVPGGKGLLSVEGEGVRVTAIKRHESRDTLVVRLFNLSDAPAHATLKLGREVESAWRVDLLEERIEDLPPGRQIDILLAPYEITTIELAFGGGRV